MTNKNNEKKEATKDNDVFDVLADSLKDMIMDIKNGMRGNDDAGDIFMCDVYFVNKSIKALNQVSGRTTSGLLSCSAEGSEYCHPCSLSPCKGGFWYYVQ